MNPEEDVPRLPNYPNPAIQKPGILTKMMSRMMKLPQRHMPRHAMRKVTRAMRRGKSKFY